MCCTGKFPLKGKDETHYDSWYEPSNRRSVHAALRPSISAVLFRISLRPPHWVKQPPPRKPQLVMCISRPPPGVDDHEPRFTPESDAAELRRGNKHNGQGRGRVHALTAAGFQQPAEHRSVSTRQGGAAAPAREGRLRVFTSGLAKFV